MTSKKIFSKENLLPHLQEWRKNGKIVFTNGCFDILHLGHVDYLEKARALGDKLIVGLNTDSLEFVDAVILFEEDTPFDLISYLKPDILVKGDDYTIEKIIGSDIVLKNGGSVKTVPLVKGYSTSNIISKIKNTN
jgi:D-glycero-beta-D-manno-heptose 1-phosphate adenylyltransferase